METALGNFETEGRKRQITIRIPTGKWTIPNE